MYLNNYEEYLLQEGLIKSHDVEKLKKSLSLFFNKYHVKYSFLEFDEHSLLLTIDFSNATELIISLYIKLINNLGYYENKYFVNGEKYLKQIPYFNNSFIFDVELSKKFDISFKDSNIKYLYHITLKTLYDKIKNKGLTVRNSKLWENYPNRIYLMLNDRDLMSFATKKREQLEKELLKNSKNHLIKTKRIDDWVVLKIDLSKIKNINLFSDLQFESGESVYTMDYIPPSSISIKKELNLNSDCL